MFAQRSASGRRLRTAIARRPGDPDGSLPLVEYFQHVCFAEVDFHRPAPRTLAIVPLEIAVNARERHLERNALPLPIGDAPEGRADHTNQVTVVFPAEIRFYLAAVVGWFRSHTILRP